MRKAVAGEKALQANDAAGILWPDQHRAADPALDQADPAQDQRAHDALAEIGFGDQQRAQSLRRNQERFDVALGMAVDQRDAAGELADLGEKLPRPLVDHRRDVAEAVALGDRDMAGQHHEHAGPGLAGFEQHFAVLVTAQLAEPAHARDFLRRQRRKGLLEAGKRACRRGAAIGLGSSRGGHSHLRLTSQEGSKTCRGPNPVIRPAFLRRRHVVRRLRHGKVRDRDVVSSPRLRFPPLEVFAQRLLQPIPLLHLFSPARRPGPRLYPCHPSSWTRSKRAAIARLYCVSFADRAIADPGEGPRPRWSCFREFYLSSQLYRVMIRPIKALAALARKSRTGSARN